MNPNPEEVDEIPQGVELFELGDHASLRNRIYDGVREELQSSFPQTYGGVRLELGDVDYADPGEFSLADQKQALLGDKYLARRLRGTVRLYDDASNNLLDEKQISLMRVPHLTDRGTFIHGGNEYTSMMQARLLPGVYTRKQENGELETHFNVRAGSGTAFRVGFEPASAQYRMRIQQANLHLYSLLHDLGVPDEQLSKSWGHDVLGANAKKYDSRVLDKAYERLVPKRLRQPDASRDEKAQAIRDAFEAARINQYVARKNLPNLFDMQKSAEWRARGLGQRIGQVRAELRGPAKQASTGFHEADYRLLAQFLNEEHQAGIDLQAPASQIAQEIEAFLRQNTDLNADVLMAGIQGLRRLREGETPEMPEGAYLPAQPRDELVVKEASAPGLYWMTKLARYGAGVLFKQPNGKYLLQKNHDDGALPQELVGKLRPAGGGKSKRDANLRQTIIREIEEEFGIPKDETADKIRLLGYIPDGKFKDCALFEMEDHGLRPGEYWASNSKTEKVILVEADLDHKDYIGTRPEDLRPYHRESYKPVIEPLKGPRWIGFDLDRTLAHREEGDDLLEIGEPVKRMVKILKAHLEDGDTCKIFTARAGSQSQKNLIKRWLARNGLPDLEVTNVKDPACICIYDDIARQVEPNTGKVVKSASDHSDPDIQRLWELARKDPGFNLEQMAEHAPSHTEAIRDGDRIVGFYTPETSNGGNPMMGEIFVDPAHRRKGHAYRASKEFKTKHKGMVWFSHANNKASRGLAEKLGLHQQEAKTLLPGNVFYGEPEQAEAEDARSWKQASLKLEGYDSRPDSDYDAEELALGIEEEAEHTDDLEVRKLIAKDHLDEDPKYYSRAKTQSEEVKSAKLRPVEDRLASQKVRRHGLVCPACGGSPTKVKVQGDALQCGKCEKTTDMEAWEQETKSATAWTKIPPAVRRAIEAGDFDLLSRMGRAGGRRASQVRALASPAMQDTLLKKIQGLWPAHAATPDAQHFLSAMGKEAKYGFCMPENPVIIASGKTWNLCGGSNDWEF